MLPTLPSLLLRGASHGCLHPSQALPLASQASSLLSSSSLALPGQHALHSQAEPTASQQLRDFTPQQHAAQLPTLMKNRMPLSWHQARGFSVVSLGCVGLRAECPPQYLVPMYLWALRDAHYLNYLQSMASYSMLRALVQWSATHKVNVNSSLSTHLASSYQRAALHHHEHLPLKLLNAESPCIHAVLCAQAVPENSPDTHEGKRVFGPGGQGQESDKPRKTFDEGCVMGGLLCFHKRLQTKLSYMRRLPWSSCAVLSSTAFSLNFACDPQILC